MTEPPTIDSYLDELADFLAVSPRRARRILAEVEDHLISARESLVDAGFEIADAEREAVDRFGSAASVAHGFNRRLMSGVIPTVESIALPLAGLTAIGLLAIGASGLLALILGWAAGKDFISGNLPGVTYTASRCQQFFALHPEVADCNTAAVAHHFDEVVGYRIAAGALGIIATVAYFVVRHFRKPTPAPRTFVPTIGTATFGLVGMGLTLLGIAQTLSGGPGGENLSAGIVALVVAAVFCVRLVPLLVPSVSR